MRDALRLGAVCAISTGVFSMATPIFARRLNFDPLLPSSLYLIFLALCFATVRLSFRWASGRSERSNRTSERARSQRVLLVGAGDAGELVVRELLRAKDDRRLLIGIVDDDPMKLGTELHGVQVLGVTKQIPRLVASHGVQEVLLALPSVAGSRIRDLVGLCASCGVPVRTLPGVSDLIAGRTVVNQIREIDISDLLRRAPVAADIDVGSTYIEGQVVLITGGGGSIGGELARQVARMSPKKLIIVGKGENSIFEVEQQIRLDGLPAPLSLVGDVRDRERMDRIFSEHRPNVVFHAAAHKHVPLMEQSPIEAIRNNVWGTRNMIELAVLYEARKFIFVSTDKAVDPVNVMGATKRVAERIVCSHAGRGTDCAVVRFGNVLGSRGSLVPMVKMQIAKGGPVQITHRDMTRYFMTIPEAVHLIVQAGSLGRNGEIFILDMGEPVRVLDLAEDLIRLHGFEPGKTMQIVFTGPRPGEKLHEKLTCDSEQVQPTLHPKIRSAKGVEDAPWEVLRDSVDDLFSVCDEGNAADARLYLMALAKEKALPTIKLSRPIFKG